MIGVPEGFAAAEIPAGERACAGRAAKAPDVIQLGVAIKLADGADAAVPFKDAVPEMAGI